MSSRCPTCGCAVLVAGNAMVPDLENVAGLPSIRRAVLRWVIQRLGRERRGLGPRKREGYDLAITRLRYWAETEHKLAQFAAGEEVAE